MTTKLDAIRQRARGPMFHPVPPAAASYVNVLWSQDVALMEWTNAIRTDVPLLLAVVDAARLVSQWADNVAEWPVPPPLNEELRVLRAALAPLLEPEG